MDEIGGYRTEIDWPKVGPSLLIGTCLILAIRTAKWPANFDERLSEHALETEIAYAAHLANRVLGALISKKENLFPTRKVPWYQPSDEDVPK